jgi:hypothetical protein
MVGSTRSAGPDALTLDTPVRLYGRDLTTRGDFTVAAGESVPFVLMWHPSHLESPRVLDAFLALEQTEKWWREWTSHCQYDGPVARARGSLEHHLEGAHLCANRRHRCRANDFTARAAWRRAQLGLPLLLVT